MLFVAVDQRFLNRAAFTNNDTAVPIAIEPERLIDNILQVLPETSSIAVVIGRGQMDELWHDELASALQPFAGRLNVVWFDELSFEDMRARAAALPSHSAILYTVLSIDAHGVPYSENQALSGLHAVTNAPIFGWYSNQLGQGIVGGSLIAFEPVAQRAATVAVRILHGESPGYITTPPQRAAAPVYDWRELRRWGIGENRLPPASIVQFREVSPWERYRWQIIAVASVCLGEAGLVLGLLVTQIKRRRAEGLVREGEQRFRLLTDAMPVMVWMANAKNESVHANRAYLDFTGRPLEAELGTGWMERVHPDDLKRIQAIYLPASERREPFQTEYRLRRHDGEYRWVLVIGVPRFTLDGSFVGYIGSAMDVTVHKLAEAALSGLSRKLMEAHEEERSRIAGELHDDICQRLAALTMQLQSLEHTQLADTHRAIRDLCKQTIDVTRDLQILSRQLHSSRLEYLGLATAAAGLCRELSEQQAVEIAFRHDDIPDDLPKDVALGLYRVLQEALNNAVKHSGVRRFAVSLHREENEIQLEVVDEGIGFDPNAAMRNHGLGLISIRERMSALHGDVVFESRPGAGTRVRARVPLSRELISASTSQPLGVM
jgi:PAS domain S-box-containing protein